MVKDQKGITLIALITTIILLLIISSITISTIISGDGILEHANSQHNKVIAGIGNLSDKIGFLEGEGAPEIEEIPDEPIEKPVEKPTTNTTTGNKTNTTTGNKTNTTTGNKTNTATSNKTNTTTGNKVGNKS